MVSSARFTCAVVTATAGWGVTGALASLAVATTGATFVLAWLADVPRWWRDVGGSVRRDLVEVARAAERVAAFLVLTNLDVLLARHYLSAQQAGIYAFASLFAKAGLWGPQFFAVVAFPRLASNPKPSRLYLRTAAATAAFGAVLVVVAATLADPMIRAVSGQAYAGAAAYAPAFAVLGTVFALVNLSLVASVAVHEKRFGLVTWMASGSEVVVVSIWLHDSIEEVLFTCTAVALVTAIAGALLTAAREPRRLANAAEPSAAPTAPETAAGAEFATPGTWPDRGNAPVADGATAQPPAGGGDLPPGDTAAPTDRSPISGRRAVPPRSPQGHPNRGVR
jgi:O-antigen/teichoic acid export membrane protein